MLNVSAIEFSNIAWNVHFVVKFLCLFQMQLLKVKPGENHLVEKLFSTDQFISMNFLAEKW